MIGVGDTSYIEPVAMGVSDTSYIEPAAMGVGDTSYSGQLDVLPDSAVLTIIVQPVKLALNRQ